MYPLLFRLGAWHFPAYLVFASGAFLLTVFLMARRARQLPGNPAHYLDLVLVCGVAGFIGARLFHILFELPHFYWRQPAAIFKFWYGGFVLYGGIILGTLGGWLFARYRRLPILATADVATPLVLLSVGFGRLGCFLAGCCYGKPTVLQWPFAVVFRTIAGVVPQASPLNTPLLPTQIADALLCLVLYFTCLRVATRKRFHGAVAVWGLIGYSLGRFFIEYMRNDTERGVYMGGWLSTSQFLSVLFLIGGVWIWYQAGKNDASHSI